MFQYQINIELNEIGSHGVLPTFSGATQLPKLGTRIGNHSQRVDVWYGWTKGYKG